jgi:Putative auto-transporter adhesin, head GIN domain
MIKLITIIIKFIVVTIMALLFSSCVHTSMNFGDRIKGSGNITTETRNISQDFTKIEVSNGIKVIIEQSNHKSITVETDDNLQENIITKIENGVLKIEANESYNATETPVVNVKLPVINGLKTDSGSEITSQNVLITENLEAKASSGSEITIEVEADFIKIESESGSHVEANGKALKLETYSSSGSEIDAENLLTNEIIAKSESGSSTSTHPIVKLEAKASSGSSISYHKNPKKLSKEENSGGSVSEE